MMTHSPEQIREAAKSCINLRKAQRPLDQIKAADERLVRMVTPQVVVALVDLIEQAEKALNEVPESLGFRMRLSVMREPLDLSKHEGRHYKSWEDTRRGM